MISEQKEIYQRMWERPEYRLRSPGFRSSTKAIEWCDMKAGDSIVDWGCGTGKASRLFYLFGMNVIGIDITETALETETKELVAQGKMQFLEADISGDFSKSGIRAAWCFCCDVLEHIPPEKVNQTLRNIAQCALLGGFLKISNRPDGCGSLIGEILHLSLFSWKEWEFRIGLHFKIVRQTSGIEKDTRLYQIKRKR